MMEKSLALGYIFINFKQRILLKLKNDYVKVEIRSQI